MEFTGERFIPTLEERQIRYEHLQRYLSVQDLVKGKIVVDAAAGEGYGSYILSESAESVTGIDIDEGTIKEAQRKYLKPNLEYKTGSIESLPFLNNSIDVLVSFETIEHVEESLQYKFLSEIQRVLKPDGLLIISTPNKTIYSDLREYSNPFHIKEFYADEFEAFLKGFFPFVQIYHQKNEVSSILTQFQGEEKIRQLNLEGDGIHTSGMYLIAVCGKQQFGSLSLGSSLLFPNEYQQMIERILSLQDEVNERNAHVKKLDEHIKELIESIHYYQNKEIYYEQNIEQYRKSVGELEMSELLLKKKLQKLQEEVSTAEEIIKGQAVRLFDLHKKETELNSIIETLQNEVVQTIEKSSGQLNQKNEELRNKQSHIEELLNQERRLKNILESDGWKLLTRYYKTRDAFFPSNSKRKLLSKLVFRTMKNPKEMFGSLNKQNFKKLRYYLKVEDSSKIENRIDNFLERKTKSAPPEIKLIPLQAEKDKLIFSVCESPDVSIIIPVYNQWEYTYSCLSSILCNTSDINYEVIIADDMSSDETIKIGEYVENIHVIRDGANRGFLLNCNNAAKYAKGKYLFFLNNDTNVQQYWLTSLLELMESNELIGMSGSKLVYPDGRLQEAGGIIWNDASGWNYGRLDDPEKAEYNYVKEVDYISGAAIMIRKPLWETIGGFDERYVPAYYEDTDLAFEVRRKGYKVVLQPKSVIVHFEGISHGTSTSSGIKSYQIKNKETFANKWDKELKNYHFNNAEHVFWARDRSRGKKTIVVVDHYVPHYDKDAGGRCTYMYLKLYREMGYHVIFIGDNFFRHEPYTTELQQLGIEVLYGNWYASHINEWIKRNGQYIDFVYLNRPHISIKYIDTVRKYSDAKIIYFGHDLHYLRELRNYQLDPNPELLKSSERWKEIEFELFNKADVIHVVGSYEQEILNKDFPEKNIRNIPLYIYDIEKNTGNTPFEKRKDLLFVGGFNHKPNQDGLMWFIKDIFPQIIKRQSNIRLIVAGSNPTDEIKALNSDRVIVKGYVSDEELELLYSQCRVAVVPLRFGAGVKGKVVESCFYGLPVVTTSIGAEGLKGVEAIMMIADETGSFATNVTTIYQEQNLWDELSSRSKEYVKGNFSKEYAEMIITGDL